MSIVYPLALPSVPGARGVTLTANFIVAQTASPFTAQQQVYEHPGSWWSAQFDLPTLTRAQAEAWIAFLLSLNGRSGSFLFGDPAGTAPLGSAGGSPIVNGAAQTGKSLNISGLTGVLKAGDYFSIGSGLTQRLYKNLTDQGPGVVTLDIFPRLRESPANAAPLTLTNAQGVFALAENLTSWSIDNAKLYGLSFKAMERF
jgi:hypothetical protein